MTARTIVVALLALVCGGSAVIGVNEMTKNREAAEVAKVPVVVAVRDMPRGSMLSKDSLKLEDWPAASVPDGALHSIEEATERCTMTPIYANEWILDSKLASKEAGRGLAARITKGMRAFTIQTAHASAGVGGFVMPDDRVDVLHTVTTSAGKQSSSRTLLQNVKVLAVAQSIDAPDTNVFDPADLKNVTLLVTPQQAKLLDLAMNKGSLHLTLRNPEDDSEIDLDEQVPDPEVMLASLLETPDVANVEQVEEVDEGSWNANIVTLRNVYRGKFRVESRN